MTLNHSDGRRQPRRRIALLEQLGLGLDPVKERWRFSSVAARSRYLPRIRQRLDFVRGFFPELDGISIRVGLARARNVLGRGSLDPDEPGIWIRPRLLHTFTIAHELVHLLQARDHVPGGEKACDLYALARSHLLVDSAPTYLKVPDELREAKELDAATRMLLHRIAVLSVSERETGRRQYLRYFERTFAKEFSSLAQGNSRDVVGQAPACGAVSQAGRR